MILSALLILIGVVAAVVGCYFIGVALNWRNALTATRFQYDKLLGQTLYLEREKARSDSELTWLKKEIEDFSHKPVMAVINQEQFSALLQMVSAKIDFEKANAEEKRLM